MIKKYPWHFIYLVFVLIALVNIFQKIESKSSTDGITWETTPQGLVCVGAPKSGSIQTGDILLDVNRYVITSRIDLYRVIQNKKYCRYEIERDEMSRNVGVDIIDEYTPFSYYILVFSGIILILLTLWVLNTTIKQEIWLSPPAIFYLLGLCFAGFLIFSPTGKYDALDFLFLFLDTVAFIFFPALLLHFSLYFPIRSGILRRFRPRFLNTSIYLVPSAILLLNLFFVFRGLARPDTESLLYTLNQFRHISLVYFAVYLLLSLIQFLVSNLKLLAKHAQKKFLFPLLGVSISIITMLVFTVVPLGTSDFSDLILIAIVFLPLSLTYYLGHRRFTDVELIIKKTLSLSSILLFIFGIYFLLGSDIMQNRLMGIFWSMAAILTAGLIFKPIEETVLTYVNKIFFRSSFDFKEKLKELILSLRQERDIASLARNFLQTINNGFQLQGSAFLVHYRKNIFYTHPEQTRVLLSRKFQENLFRKDRLSFLSADEFGKRFPKDVLVMQALNYFQFLPLKTQDQLIGLVAFGPKTDNTYLSVEDWDLLSSISSSLTLSVENAFLYSELTGKFKEISLLKEFNENIIENVNFGLVVLSSLNIIQVWNHFMEVRFRIPAARAINRKAHNIFDHPLWKKIYEKKQREAFFANEKVWVFDSEFIFDIYLSPLRDNLGKTIGTILVFEDVTEKIYIQNQLITSEKLASLGLLSAGIAHEVNTPLTGISSYCQFILENPHDPANSELVLKIQEQVKRANKIIRSLLDFSRQKGEQPLELDLNKVIDTSISLVEHQFKKKNPQLRKDYDFKSRITGFSTRLQQLFINLLINANDALENENGLLTITGAETGEDLLVSISDNGRGISEKDLEKIFDPFFTTKDQGTGLGLSICYNIVEEHYGTIKVQSKLTEGTVFTITFPRQSPLRSIKI